MIDLVLMIVSIYIVMYRGKFKKLENYFRVQNLKKKVVGNFKIFKLNQFMFLEENMYFLLFCVGRFV